MNQLPHDEFETSLEKAEAWMKEIHERLKENDNTQGPRSALESRLRETENICALEPDGKMLVDKVLMKAEVLLGESSEEETHEIHLKLAKIKGLFEETTTYMIHCHSRIEWVWLHWNEYLRARDEFTLWVHNIVLTLEPDVELQLGRKEKLWQYEQARVLVKDVLNHSLLVDRLLEEAASLYNRIGDPSVDESVQSAIMAEYIRIKKKAQERVEQLEKIWKDHEAYEGDVKGFKTWLNSVIEKLKLYVGAASDCTENRLDILQEISKDVESGHKQLEVLEMKSAQVIKNTSPMGAEKICKELEELRKTLKELKQMNDEEEDTLLKTHSSENAFLLLARQLEANINEFRKATQRLEESLESGERVKSEDDLINLWKTLNATKSALAAEEAKAERVKVQLRDLFKFSKDVQPLSDGVISAMRDYQRAKSKAFKLSTDTESELRQLFQNPLREFLYWKPIAESVLDATAVPMNDGAMNHDALDNIEKLLEESGTIKDKLAALEKKKERILLVLGEEKTRTHLQDIATAEKEREALHQDLLQRKNSLQSLAEQRKEFDSAFKALHQKISAIRVKSMKENELQPDIIGKEAQIQRLQTLLEELMILSSPIQELISATRSHSTHAHRAEQIHSDYLTLQRSLETKIRKSKENINNHRLFSHNLRDLQHWIMITRQKLESYQNGGKNWGERDVEALVAELSEKEIQRHLVEAQGQKVMDTSSPEGAALIQAELKQLIESWKSLQQLCEQISRGVKEKPRKSSPKSVQNPADVTKNRTSSPVSHMGTDDFLQRDKTPTSKRTGTSISHEGQVININSLDDVRVNGSPRNMGFQQFGGSSGTSFNARTNSITEVADGDPGYNKYNKPPEVSGQKENSRRISGSGNGSSSPGRSKNSRNKSAAEKRKDGTCSIDRSSYEFRVIDQEDEKSESPGSDDTDGHSISSTGNTDNGKKNISIDHEFGQIEKRGTGGREANGDSGEDDAQGHGLNFVSVRFSSLDRRTSPSHPPTKSPAVARGGLTARTSLLQDGDLHRRAGYRISPGNLQITLGFVAEENMNWTGKSPNNPGASRRNQKLVTLAESVDMVDAPGAQRPGGNEANDDHMKLLLEFEQWLQAESSKLNRMCASHISSNSEIKTRQSHLQKLQSRVPHGQKLFESLLRSRSSMMVTEDLKLEELRYLWMLYKSKLRDSGKHTNLKISEEPRGVIKGSGGICSFLHRVCCAALPLQLLLLLLLLLAFLLPLLYDSKNCALSNNFARSFNLMLKYDGPPPT
ncbi:nesprin-3 isoform X2 [Bufo gargarizans]|uniref:nesprin-3 isoform X2 n=1 Tax=Bufo gargarizans TaxID=30331 RepID=UPI001CF5DAAC|nr:nesprin-3 isoform X2 [Bufo gargarizans]